VAVSWVGDEQYGRAKKVPVLKLEVTRITKEDPRDVEAGIQRYATPESRIYNGTIDAKQMKQLNDQFVEDTGKYAFPGTWFTFEDEMGKVNQLNTMEALYAFRVQADEKEANMQVGSRKDHVNMSQIPTAIKAYIGESKPLPTDTEPLLIGQERDKWAAVHLSVDDFNKDTGKPDLERLQRAYAKLQRDGAIDKSIPIENVAFCPARLNETTNACVRVTTRRGKEQLRGGRTAPAASFGQDILAHGQGAVTEHTSALFEQDPRVSMAAVKRLLFPEPAKRRSAL
jgi:hypothetical protein